MQDTFFEIRKVYITNKVKDIPRYTPTFCHAKTQMTDLTCLTIIKSYIKPCQWELGVAVVT